MHHVITILTNSCTPLHNHNSTFPLGAILTSFDQILFINQISDSTQSMQAVVLQENSRFNISDKKMIETY